MTDQDPSPPTVWPPLQARDAWALIDFYVEVSVRDPEGNL